MISLPIISIVLCFAYIIFILFKYGVPVSISETYYLLPNKWDWLFSAWCSLTAIPFGFWWFTISPKNLCWIPIVVVLCMVMIGVSCRYKSGPKRDGGDNYVPEVRFDTEKPAVKKSFKEFIKELLEKFKPSVFFKYGWARPIHYISSLVTITLVTVYLCLTSVAAIASMVLSYVMFILIGVNTPGAYNPDYSVDVDNKAWIFFMEVVCFLQLFIFVWDKI